MKNNYIIMKAKNKLYRIFLIVLVINTLIIFNIDTMDTITINAFIRDNAFYSYVPYKEVMDVMKNHQLFYENKIYNYVVAELSQDIEIINNQSVQLVKFNISDFKVINNLVLELKIIQGKRKLYQKITEVINK